MDISIIAFIAFLLIVWAANQFVKEYLIAKAIRQAYEQNVRRVITDPNSQVKGRFE